MLVVPKQRKFIALKIEYTPEFFIQLGKYLDGKYYEIKKEPSRYSTDLYLKNDDNSLRAAKDGDYILFDEEEPAIWAYVKKEVFEKTYLVLKEEEIND